MCGFAGIVVWEGRYAVNPFTLQRMCNRLAHRGPDGEGVWLNHDREPTPDLPQCGLAFRRLAILDLDERSNQPFVSTDGRYTLVFNGEIYNFREVREELSRLNPEYTWRTTGDSEVLLMAFAQWRQKCVGRLNGMYAFAVWDAEEKSLSLVRDRMGQKPLFYSRLPGAHGRNAAIAFASELHALRAVEWFDEALDPAAVSDYLRWGWIAAPHTIYASTRKLLPGTWVRCTGGTISAPQEYFNPNLAPPPEAGIDFVATTRRLVTEAVRRQLVSDVPLGCFLSGGVDSSVVAAAMRATVTAGQPLHTFSIGFDDVRYDETKYAAAVARHLKTKHQSFTVKPDAVEDLPKLARVYGEPFGDSSALPTHYLSRETRRHVKVALSGDGGDELFGGYDRYRAMLIGQRVQALPGPLRRLVTARLWQKLPGAHPKGKLTRFKRLARSIDQPPAARYAGYLRLFDDRQLAELLNEPATPPTWSVTALYAELHKSRDLVQSALAADRASYLPDDLLVKLDRASMLHGLEVRSPFMDHELVRFAAVLPTDLLLKGGSKRLLREAFAPDLPAEVFKRPKMGFAVPIGEWFRRELRPMLRDLLGSKSSFASQHFRRDAVDRLVEQHEQQFTDHSQRLYALLMLELWWRQHHAR